jgi:phosphate transport system substrate-binding protein
MPLLVGLRTMVLGAIGVVMASSPALATTLKIGGTGAVTELLNQLGPAFKADSGITVDVIAGLGTSGANNAVAAGKLGLAISGRALRDKEKANGLRIIASFRTPFGLVTSRDGQEDFKRGEIAGLYGQDRPLWRDGKPILITLRPVDESDNATLGELFPGMTEAILQLRKRTDLAIAPTDQDNADMAEKREGSLNSASLTQIVSEKRNLRFVSIDGVAATLENYENGSYPYSKPLYVVAPAAVSAEAEVFLAFLAKPATAALLRRAGVIAAK